MHVDAVIRHELGDPLGLTGKARSLAGSFDGQNRMFKSHKVSLAVSMASVHHPLTTRKTPYETCQRERPCRNRDRRWRR
jgi:hypothetical protein